MTKVLSYSLELFKGRKDDGLPAEAGPVLDQIIKDFLRHVIRADPDHRPRHYALLVLTLENEDQALDGEQDIVTTDIISSMGRDDIHSSLRDWLHKETQ